MGDNAKTDGEDFAEKAMLVKQSLKYAEDIARIYEEEKAKRRELEVSNEKLRREIAHRIETEKALKESEERFRAIFEAAQDCIYIKDFSLRYRHVNPAMKSLLQLPSSQIVGRMDEELFGKTVGRRLTSADRRVLQGEAIEEEHTRLINGVPRTFLENKFPLRSPSGEVTGLCGISRDITDRKRTGPVRVASDSQYRSKAMRDALQKARLIARQDTIALLLGESGSGKDYMARFIHDNSYRADGPFFSINCASVAAELAESELFGHEAGAFTGASGRKRGLLELAEGGTLLLNEIGELSPAMQAKLLTFLDTKSFTRVGGERAVSVNARLIAATNRDLEQEAEKGRFRHDLFFRLNVVSLRIPPLRQRREDIAILVREIIARLQGEMRLSSPPVLEDSILDALKAADWPGNVRELRNCLERALILSGGGNIELSDLGIQQIDHEWAFATTFPEARSLNAVTRELKSSLILEALRRSRGNKVAAARLLKISRNSLNHYLRTLKIG